MDNQIIIPIDPIEGEINRKAVDRMKICLKCEYFFELKKECSKSGNFMPTRTRLPEEKCPIDKW